MGEKLIHNEAELIITAIEELAMVEKQYLFSQFCSLCNEYIGDEECMCWGNG
jgi:hypothetical protein